MDWNLAPCNTKGNHKLMLNTSSSPLNPMAAVFYTRPSMSGLEDHSSPTMRGDGLLYGGFEGSDQESVDVEVNEQDPLHHVEKKRRLTVEQVRSLELNFEIENKLEPERKKQLAHELGLQPRQVAVWFQNRRARWKTKQLERDYDTLKASYDNLISDNKRLQAEVINLTSKLEAKSPSTALSEMMEQKLDVSILCESNNNNNQNTNTAGKAMFDMEVERIITTRATAATVASGKRKKAEKEGSPCSDGYTSEILDAEYSASEAVPVVEENIPFQQQPAPQSCAVGAQAGPSDPFAQPASAAAAAFFQQTVTKSLKEEPDGIVYDPHSINSANNSQVVMIPFKFEDGLLFNSEPDDGNPSFCFLADDQSITPWWT